MCYVPGMTNLQSDASDVAGEPVTGTKVAYYYRRRACAMCRKTQAVLDAHRLVPQLLEDADANPVDGERAHDLAGRVARVLVARGGQLLTFDMRDKAPTRRQLLEVILAPSGNLRAPALIVADHLLVGYHADALAGLVGAQLR